ncbi:dynein light chain 4, axonemal [Ctenocephalides felis]|uniref:dynein light chain 4, axonemal n=1 Tax=Ctenocephalides felis TaxID=7515 RepID=UPI000E6E4AD1|nr:dynein light chain 4, axonemal [Ctenocephalides felis]
MAEEEAGAPKAETEKRVVHTYPLVKFSDMSDEMKSESVELAVTACEKFAANNEAAARMVKEAMDKKFGPSWHVVVGEGFGFEVSYQTQNLMYMYNGGTVGVCIWKCT